MHVRLKNDAGGTLFDLLDVDNQGVWACIRSCPGYAPLGVLMVVTSMIESDEDYQRRYPSLPPFDPIDWRRRALEVGNV
jgi:hypothetical protein